MKIENLNFGFPVILIDDYYSKNELSLIWNDLNFFGDKNILYSENNPRSGSATDGKGNILKKNYTVFLDDLFSYDRNFSNILKVNRKLFTEWENIIKQNNHWIYQNFVCLRDTTIVSYYENDNFYDLHRDCSYVTSLFWTYKEPKRFQGGNLIFESGDEIEVINNRMIIFPSTIRHGVKVVTMEDEYLNKKNGRFCITQFLHYQ